MDTFIFLRNLTIFFASAMLLKYFIYLLIAPWYRLKEEWRNLRNPTKTGEKMPLVTVIIPAWNEEVGVTRSIQSLLDGDYSKIEIVVVNDGSNDKTDAVVRDLIERIRRERLLPEGMKIKYFVQNNSGKGVALNTGLSKATGEIVITMDADSIFAPNAVSNLVRYFDDPKIDAVVGNVRVAHNGTLIGTVQQLEYLFGFYFKRAAAVLGAEYIFGGACSAYRRSVFERIGPFATENKTEDIEMSMRTRYHGMSSAYAENVVCYTEGASTMVGLIQQRLRWKKGRFDTFLKYRRLFFSLEGRHNSFLSWFVLPYSLFGELQLLFEPMAISLLISYSVIANDYLSLLLSAGFVFVVYVVNAFVGDQKFNWQLIPRFFITWILFYLLVWVEFLALIKSVFLILRGEDVAWQNWERQGVAVTTQI